MRQVKERAVRNVVVAAVDDHMRTQLPYHAPLQEVQALMGEARYTLDEALRGATDLDWGPFQLLQKELQRSAALVQWFESKILNMAPQELAEAFWKYRRSTETQAGSAREFTDGEAMKAYAGVYYDLYMRERTHFLNVIRTAHQCGIEDRLLKLEESKAELVGRTLYAFAESLGLDVKDPTVRDAARNALEGASRSMRELPTGGITGG
jgi:hypothetical protein